MTEEVIDIETCESCKFWKDETEAADKVKNGTCRRYPATILCDEGVFACQPMTESDEWCGEYARRLH